MVPFVSDHGFTADVHSSAVTVRSERRIGRTPTLLAMAIPLVLILAVLSTLGRSGADADSSPDTPRGLYYDFRVHALNCTSLSSTANGTLFRFNADDLPFEFSSICFGDYRADGTFSQKYYGGSGILVDATGLSTVMTLREGGGQFISAIDYHGQAQVVFNGKVESVTFPSNSTTYDGTDRIIQDWREGSWSPQEGVLVEHTSNVTLADAKFYLMTLEPSGTTDIPEFDPLLTVGAMIALFLIIRIRAPAKE